MFDNESLSEKEIKITELREELHALLEKYGLNHNVVLELSKKLDKVLLELL
jgi:hypothetical protein